MTAVYTTQYQPHATAETAASDALSVAFWRDVAESINSTKAHLYAIKVLSEVAVPIAKYKTPDNGTENTMAVFAPRHIPEFYSKLTVVLGGNRTDGANGTDWKLYASWLQYKGPLVYDSAYAWNPAVTAAISIATDANAIPAAITLTLPDKMLIPTGFDSGLLWLWVTAKNGAGTRSQMTTLDAWVTQ